MANNSWANRAKQDLSSVPTKQLKAVGAGSLPPINVYFQFSAPKEGAPESAKQLMPGDTIVGQYNGSFTTKKFGTTYHKVMTENGLVAIPGAGQINTLIKQVPVGAEVQVVYNGKEAIKKGQFAGKMAHSFSLSASETIAA